MILIYNKKFDVSIKKGHIIESNFNNLTEYYDSLELQFFLDSSKVMAKDLKVSIVKDICKEFHGGDAFNQDRRCLSNYLELFTINQNRLNLTNESSLFSHKNLFKYMTDTEILPPVEEVYNQLYKSYDSDFSQMYAQLKYE